MGVVYAGCWCYDPRRALEDCQRLSLPTAWAGKPSSFTCLLGGADASRGWVILTKGALDGIDLNTTHDLEFVSGKNAVHRVTLKNLLVYRMDCLSPGARGDKAAPFLVELRDRRYLYRGIPIDAAYNVLDGTGTAATYHAATKNAGSAWTWATMTEAIWNTVGTSRLGTFPGLPFTPHGTPENFQFYAGLNGWSGLRGGFALDALVTVLRRVGCDLKLDPVADTFSIVQLGDDDADETTAERRHDGQRVWDSYPSRPPQARLPRYVRVWFRRTPEPAAGTSPWYAVDVEDVSPTTGFNAVGYAHVFDDLGAIGATGAPSNSATLDARAAERAADWFRTEKQHRDDLHRVYAQSLSTAGFRGPGALLRGVRWKDTGGGMVTEVLRGPSAAEAAAGVPPGNGGRGVTGPVSIVIGGDSGGGGGSEPAPTTSLSLAPTFFSLTAPAGSTVSLCGTVNFCNTSVVTFSDGGTLNVNADTTFTANSTLTIADTTPVTVAGDLTFTSASVTTFNDNSVISIAGDLTLTGTSNVVVADSSAWSLGSTTWTVANGDTWTITGTGTGSVTFASGVSVLTIAATTFVVSTTLYGSTASGGFLTLGGTTHATKGGVRLASGEFFTFPEVSAPGTPASGLAHLYADSTGIPHWITDGGVDYDLTTAGRAEGTLAAAGSTQGDAAAIVTEAVEVTGADGTKGVILPDVEGAVIVVWNNSASILNVYPPSGARISTASTDVALAVGGTGIVVFYRVTATQWTNGSVSSGP